MLIEKGSLSKRPAGKPCWGCLFQAHPKRRRRIPLVSCKHIQGVETSRHMLCRVLSQFIGFRWFSAMVVSVFVKPLVVLGCLLIPSSCLLIDGDSNPTCCFTHVEYVCSTNWCQTDSC